MSYVTHLNGGDQLLLVIPIRGNLMTMRAGEAAS
jgi:hypothetical protein